MLRCLTHSLRRVSLLLLAGALCFAAEARAQEATDLDAPGTALRLATPLHEDTPAVREATLDQDVPGLRRAANPLADLGLRAVEDVSDRDADQPMGAALPWAPLAVSEETLDNGRDGTAPLPRLGLAASPPLSADELDNGRDGTAPLPRLGLAASPPLSADELDDGRDAAARAARRPVLEAGAEEAVVAASALAATAETELPEGLSLGANYPNPFNPTTAIDFTVHQEAHATLKIYDVAGREVATLFDGSALPGRPYRVTFEAGDLASGLYVYQLTTAGLSVQKKMLLAK